MFRNSLEKTISQLGQSIESAPTAAIAYRDLMGCVTEALEGATPGRLGNQSNVQKQRNQKSRNHHPCPWWDKNCEELKRLRTEAAENFHNNKSSDNYLQYKKMQARARIGFRKIKKEKFIAFCQGLRKDSNPTYIWKKIKCFKNRYNFSETANQYDAETIANIQDQIESLFPPWVSRSPMMMDDLNEEEQETSFLTVDFTKQEMEYALKQANTKSSPGKDGIDYFIISHLPLNAQELLLQIYNRMFREHTYPEEWQEYLVFFIPKDETKKKYRPISLSSCVLKIMERMINNRLHWWLEVEQQLPNSQFGFRRNRSCGDNLAILQTNAYLAKERDQFTAAIFLDIKAAYDNVLVDVLMDKIRALHFPHHILSFIQNLIYKRKVTCRFEEIDECRIAFRGLPQGSVLSPLLYNIYVSELENTITQECQMIQYADDICIFTNNNNSDNSAHILKRSLSGIQSKLQELGLTLSLEKTKFCIFDLRQKVKLKTKRYLKIGDHEIRASNKIRFLGMTFTPRMEWNSHINNVWKKCQCSLKIIASLRHTWWGADPRLLKNIYVALIRSRIDYGGFLIHQINKSTRLKLNRLQYKAIRLILGLRTSSPINFLLGEIKDPPIIHRMDFLCKSFVTKVLTQETHPLRYYFQEWQTLRQNATSTQTDKDPPILQTYLKIRDRLHGLDSSPTPTCYSIPYESTLFTTQVNLDIGRNFVKKDTQSKNNDSFPRPV